MTPTNAIVEPATDAELFELLEKADLRFYYLSGATWMDYRISAGLYGNGRPALMLYTTSPEHPDRMTMTVNLVEVAMPNEPGHVLLRATTPILARAKALLDLDFLTRVSARGFRAGHVDHYAEGWRLKRCAGRGCSYTTHWAFLCPVWRRRFDQKYHNRRDIELAGDTAGRLRATDGEKPLWRGVLP